MRTLALAPTLLGLSMFTMAGQCSLTTDASAAKAKAQQVVASINAKVPVAASVLAEVRDSACEALSNHATEAQLLVNAVPTSGPRTTADQNAVANALAFGGSVCAATGAPVSAATVVNIWNAVAAAERALANIKTAAGK